MLRRFLQVLRYILLMMALAVPPAGLAALLLWRWPSWHRYWFARWPLSIVTGLLLVLAAFLAVWVPAAYIRDFCRTEWRLFRGRCGMCGYDLSTGPAMGKDGRPHCPRCHQDTDPDRYVNPDTIGFEEDGPDDDEPARA